MQSERSRILRFPVICGIDKEVGGKAGVDCGFRRDSVQPFERSEMVSSDWQVKTRCFMDSGGIFAIVLILAEHVAVLTAEFMVFGTTTAEYKFSFYVQNSERDHFLSKFSNFMKQAEHPIEVASGPIWVNGYADLVVKQKDGTIEVYDYKSDAMNGKPLTDFDNSLVQKYEGQLFLYQCAIAKAFCVTTVKAKLIHLYKKCMILLQEQLFIKVKS